MLAYDSQQSFNCWIGCTKVLITGLGFFKTFCQDQDLQGLIFCLRDASRQRLKYYITDCNLKCLISVRIVSHIDVKPYNPETP